MDKKFCLECKNEIKFRGDESSAEFNKRKFCDNSCSAKYNNKNRVKKESSYCIYCAKKLQTRAKKYCNTKCQFNFQYDLYINDWKCGKEDGLRGEYQISEYLRKYLLNKYENKCSRCGWSEINPHTNRIPLDVEHIDGNYKNNNEDNLTILCPNCHSLTKTYKSLNLGSGRKSRSKYKL